MVLCDVTIIGRRGSRSVLDQRVELKMPSARARVCVEGAMCEGGHSLYTPAVLFLPEFRRYSVCVCVCVSPVE